MFVPSKKVGTLSERPDSIEDPAPSHTESTDKLMEENNISWLEFVKRSTCAAVTHLGERQQSTIVKIIWGLTLITGLALTALSTYYSTTAYINVSGSSEMSLQPSPTAWIEHPKYHICTSNNFNSTALAEMGFVDPDMISYLMLVVSLLVVSPVLLHNIQYQVQLEKKFNQTLVENGIESIDEVIQRALFQCQDIIAGCISPEIYLGSEDCCAKYFPTSSFPSATGACVSTVNGSPIYQNISSMSFGFVVFVRDLRDSNRSLNNEIVNPILANRKGVSFSLSDKWTHPTVAIFKQNYYSRIGIWNSLSLLKTTVNDEEITESFLFKRDCASRNYPDDYRYLVPGFDNYTENNCNYASRQKKINKFVGCHVVTLPYQGDLPSCTPHQMITVAKIIFETTDYHNPFFREDTECVSECWKEMFSFSASHSDLELASNFKFGNWTMSSNQSDNLVAFNFYYSTFTQTFLVNHYPSLPDLLGGLGGNVGLFLGASMVTVVEILVFCISCCCLGRRQV